MRVMMLSWEYPPVMVGGLGRHVQELSKSMVHAGHEVTVVTRHAPGAPVEEWVDGARVLRAPEDPPLFPLSTPTLLAWAMAFNHGLIRAGQRAAQQAEFDVIHAHDWLVAQAAVTLKEQLRLPLVVTIHSTEIGRHLGWLPDEMNKRIHSVERWLGHEASRVVLCSDYMRQEASHLLGIDRDRIDVVPNGVDVLLWRTDPSAVQLTRRRYNDAGPLIGYAGRLVYEKGVQTMLHALPELRRRHPGLRLLVAGEGPHGAQLRELTNRLELRHVVTFTGFLGDELPTVMAATDVLVVPSLYEPFGMVALEAAAAGTPIAAAATGGLAEFVETGRTGVTFPASNPTALAEAVSGLLRDGTAARSMAANARRAVADRYSWDAVVRGVHGVYRKAATETSRRPQSRRTTRVAGLPVQLDGPH
jgi:glycogen(starch) synthase